DSDSPAKAEKVDVESLLADPLYEESRFIRPDTNDIRYVPYGIWEEFALKELQGGREYVTEIDKRHDCINYLGAVRFRESCISCHPTVRERESGFTYEDFK